MKFVLGYRTELFMIFLVPIQALQWYRFLRYSGTGSSAMMVPIRALRWYRLTDTITILLKSPISPDSIFEVTKLKIHLTDLMEIKYQYITKILNQQERIRKYDL